MLDVKTIRKDFSIYKNCEDLVYLDSGATSLTPDSVVDAMSEYYKFYRATVHRSKYKNGIKADAMYDLSRLTIAKFINADFSNIIFTKSTTDSINMLARELLSNLTKGDEVLITPLDHHSNQLPWREYNKDVTVTYTELDCDNLTLDSFKKSVTKNTKIASIYHVSNVMGAIAPVKEIASFCKKNNIILVIDGAQAITHEVVDVKDIDCDFYVFSGHKMCGPTGIGILYGKEDMLKKLRFEYGGDMASFVTKESATYLELPVGLEAGTPAIAEVIGLSKACEYLNAIGIDNIHNHIMELKNYAIFELSKIKEVKLYNKDTQSGIITFNIATLAAHDALQGFENGKKDICIRGGHMCNMLTLDHLSTYAVLRVSIYIYNDKQDIDDLVLEIKNIIENDTWMVF